MRKYFVATYGCQMNVHESEKIAGILQNKGYLPTKQKENADLIVFNTCCVRDTAEMRILGHIGALKSLKKTKPHLIIAVIGCMTQQNGIQKLLRKKYPFVDIILGTNCFHLLSDAIDKVMLQQCFYGYIDENVPMDINEDIPIYRTSGTNAWVNIMYGCNNFCTYCIVPYVRGRERSRKPQLILDEINKLLDDGYKEITLLGQNVDSYYNDTGTGWDFARLLENISKINGKFRLRFMSSHPKDFNKTIVDIMRDSNNICNNVHLPIQSGSDRILKLMNRKYTRSYYLELIEYIKTLDNVGITSDIMVGFPTENDDDFKETLSLVQEVRYSNAFMFVFSPRRGTVASKMEQVPAEIKKQRISKLISLQNKITKEISTQYFGKVEEILVEDKNLKYENVYCGRTDSGRLVNFMSENNLIGRFVDVKIQKANSATLWGVYEKR